MIMAFTSVASAGATFMDWSWHWLKGSEVHWNQQRGWLPLVDDPTQNKNAHGHPKNHPTNFEDWQHFLDSAREDQKDVSFYPIFDTADHTLSEYVNQLNRLINDDVGVVVIKKTQEFPVMSERSIEDDSHDFRFWLKCNGDLPKDITRKKLREIVSIRISPQQKKWLSDIDKAFKGLDDRAIIVSDNEWSTMPEETMVKILNFFGEKINNQRLLHWLPVMSRWKTEFKRAELFYKDNIPLIPENIVNNQAMDLEPYDLGFTEESLIMMSVMKTHGKRLILPDDSFPKNTQTLHGFLK